MSFHRSTRLPPGKGGASCRPRVVLLIACAAFLHASHAKAQVSTTFPPLSFRDRLELQMMGEVSSDFVHAPSLRLTLQRRHTLKRSTILSGILFLDPLDHSTGLALGQMLTFPKHNGLLEPFVEAGAAYSDARIPDGSYMVATASGARAQVIDRYRIVQGFAALAGAGLSWSTMLHERPVRLTLGYWRLDNGGSFKHGSVRLGASLGWLGGHNARWYALGHDRTPPRAIVVSREGPKADSLFVVDGKVRVLAEDAHGIARIRVGGTNIGFRPADPTSAADFGLGRDAVVGTYELHGPFNGRLLNVFVQDSAGLTTHRALWTYAAPDLEPPTVTVFGRGEDADTLDPRFRALVEDASGVADARVGICPVALVRPPSSRDDAGTDTSTVRLVRGWGTPGGGGRLEVRDRLGNVGRTSLSSPATEISRNAPPPRLTLSATFGSREGNRASVRVRGTVLDPAGGWIDQVRVDGHPTVLRVGRDPSHAEFDGWLLTDSATKQVTAVATTLDGRVVRTEVRLTEGDRPERGRLYTLLVLPESPTGLSTDLRMLARRAGDDGPRVLSGTAATPPAVLAALSELQQQVGPHDVVLVYLEGRLAGDPESTGPGIELGAGRLDLARVDHLLRQLKSGLTLVSTSFAAGRTWSAMPADVPGAPPPAGCYQDNDEPWGAVVDAGPSSPERILGGLAGGADTDRSGRVLTTELLDDLGVSPPAGLLDFDPLLTAATSGGAR